MTIELECDGSYPAFEGVSTPVSLLLQTAFQPAPGDYCAALAAGAASPVAGRTSAANTRPGCTGREVEPARYRPFIDALRRDSRIEVLVLAEEAEDADLQREPGEHRRPGLAGLAHADTGQSPGVCAQGPGVAGRGGSAAERINLAAAASDADWLIVIHAGDELARSALLLLAEKIRTETALLCCYSDEDHVCDGRYEAPLLKPDFNLDLLRSYPYCGRSLAFQRAALLAQGGLQEGFGDLALQDFMFRLAEREGLDRIGHLAEVLYHSARAFGEWLASAAVRPFIASVVDEHLNRLGVPHRIEPGRLAVINRIAYDYPGTPAVSLLLPVGDSLSALQRSVESFLENTDYPSYELLLVASGPLAPDMAAWLEAVQGLGSEQIRVLSPQASSLAGCLNLCVAEARGEFLLSLGAGSWPFVRTGCASCSTTAAARRSGRSAASSWAWTERFARRAWCLAWAARRAARSPARRETAPATCIACWSSRITRLCRLPACCSSARCTTNSAASTRTTSLMATPTSISACVPASSATCRCGRPMQSWPRTETSSCLPWRPMSRSTGAGYRHWRGIPRTTAISAWRAGFALERPEVPAWQPLFGRSPLPRVLAHPADPYGCGHYRVRQPFRALHDAGLLDGMLSESLLQPVALERLEVDSVILQRQISEEQLRAISRMRSFNRAFRVYELDDYLPELPLKSLHRAEMPATFARSSVVPWAWRTVSWSRPNRWRRHSGACTGTSGSCRTAFRCPGGATFPVGAGTQSGHGSDGPAGSAMAAISR